MKNSNPINTKSAFGTISASAFHKLPLRKELLGFVFQHGNG